MRFIKNRLRGSSVYKKVIESRKRYRDTNEKSDKINYVFSVISYVFGSWTGDYLHHVVFLYIYSAICYIKSKYSLDLKLKRAYRKQMFFGRKYYNKNYCFQYVLQYCEITSGIVYHAASKENAEKILREGLVAGKKELVYLCNNLSYFDGTNRYWYGGKKAVLLKIDAKTLCENNHKIYKIMACRDFEYVTDYVEPQCITVLREFDNGICYDPLLEDFVD